MPETLDVKVLNRMFHWRWPWPEPDPGPPWELIISRLDKAGFARVVSVQLEVTKAVLEAQRTVLEANLKAVEQLQGITKGMK